MSKIIQEVRKITSEKVAEQQSASEQKYPSLIEKIKQSAGWGKTEREFGEHEIDQYSKRLLEADGFTVYATSKIPKYDTCDYISNRQPKTIWIVRW